MVIIFCFDDGDRLIGPEVQNVIRFLRLLTDNQIPLQVDLSVRDLGLHGDQVFGPFGCNGRSNKLKLDILFSHLSLIENGAHNHHSNLFDYHVTTKLYDTTKPEIWKAETLSIVP